MHTNLFSVRTALRKKTLAEKKRKGTPLRQGKQYSQQEIADLLQIPRSKVSMIENGQALPTLEQIEKIADYLNVPVGHLVTPRLIEFLTEL